jgi:hypothetical protein
MQDEQEEESGKGLQPKRISDENNKYQLVPFQASIYNLGIHGFRYRRVAVKLGIALKAAHERARASSKHVDSTAATSSRETNSQPAFDELAEELASINLFEMLLAGYLHTKEGTQAATEIAELLHLEGQTYPDEARQKLLVDDLTKGEVLPYTDLPREEQVHSLSQVLYLSTVEQEYLVEALRITRDSRKLAEMIKEEREWSRGQAYSVRLLAAHVKQYAEQLQQQNQKNQRLSKRARWLAIGLGVSTLLGTLGALYALFLN